MRALGAQLTMSDVECSARGACGGGLQPLYNARTDVGRVREINEDRVFAGELPLLAHQPEASTRHLLIVADGVGGLERGEWASEKALTVITAELPIHLDSHEPREALQLAREVKAALEAGEIGLNASELEPFADRLR